MLLILLTFTFSLSALDAVTVHTSLNADRNPSTPSLTATAGPTITSSLFRGSQVSMWPGCWRLAPLEL